MISETSNRGPTQAITFYDIIQPKRLCQVSRSTTLLVDAEAEKNSKYRGYNPQFEKMQKFGMGRGTN